jgi:tryptophan 2,3-dioxygenase
MEQGKKYAAVHYAKYLELDEVLATQHPRSIEFGKEAHDEMLFIITHQAYELWFKQILHELEAIVVVFNELPIDESKLGRANHYLNRILEILKLLIKQLEVLETMTPMDFLEFRNYLFPASGFQSFQFRKFEVILGLKNKYRMTYGGYHYNTFFPEDQKQELEALENGFSMLELVEKWLERIPFIDSPEFNFLENYRTAIEKMYQEERREINNSSYLDEKQREMRLKMLGDNNTFFKDVFDEKAYQEKYDQGEVRISYKAMLGCLFVCLYNHEPLLQLPYQIIEKLSFIDEFVTLWRFRHGQMVQRIIGNKIGTGGSSGVQYLMQTANSHSIFKDIHYISTMMIAVQDLPPLPEAIKKQLDFIYRN